MIDKETWFEWEKEKILENFMSGTENDSALVYALVHNCSPFFHDGCIFKEFEQFCSIKSDVQQPFYAYIDTILATKTYKTFYEVEADWKSKGITRKDIIIMLKYAALTGRFTEEAFSNTLLRQGGYPDEAVTIFESFTGLDIIGDSFTDLSEQLIKLMKSATAETPAAHEPEEETKNDTQTCE